MRSAPGVSASETSKIQMMIDGSETLVVETEPTITDTAPPETIARVRAILAAAKIKAIGASPR